MLFVLASCSSDDDKASAAGDGSFVEFSLDGESVDITKRNTDFIANENCDRIYATISHISDDQTLRFRMEFELTGTGHIDNIRFVEYSDNNRNYNTVNFQPAETFSINNFSYDAATKQLYFDFDGDLYDIDDQGQKTHISGKFQYNSANSVECGFFQRHVTADNGSMHFTRWVVNTSADWVLYQFYSDNGYLMRIYSDTDIKNVSPGTYDLASGDNVRIELYKYIGETKATPLQPLYSNEWEFYDCTGTITVNSQNLQPFPHTTGTFSFQATDANGNIIFENLSGTFEM